MKLLIIEDDKHIRHFLRTGLEAEAFTVDEAADGEQGSYLARTNEYDIIILDLILPKRDGSEVCRDLRELGINTPIIMLSVQGTIERKVDLFKCGVDDYLTKPFSFDELLARIRALLRRPAVLVPEIMKVDDLVVDTARQKVSRGENIIYLTRKEFGLLEYLMRHRNRVVSRGMILEHVWNADGDPFSNTIEAHILNLRKKIDRPHLKKLIQTIPGRGYTISS